MKLIPSLLFAGALALFLASCNNGPRGKFGPNRAFRTYPSSVYSDPFPGWDVYPSGGGVRVKHTP